MYVAMTSEAISSVLVRKEDKAQKPIYYISRVLRNVEIRYSQIEKVIFAIITTIRQLRPYFQAHSVKVLTDLSLRTLLQRPDTSERMTKWAVELTKFDLSFISRSSIKVQIIVDFIIKYTPTNNGQVEDHSQEDT